MIHGGIRYLRYDVATTKMACEPPASDVESAVLVLRAPDDAAVRVFRTAAWVWLAAVSALSFASIEQPLAVPLGHQGHLADVLLFRL